MAGFHYPHVYPELDARHKEELAQRQVLLIDRHVAEEVLDPERCLAVLEAAYREEGSETAVNRTKANILVPTDDRDLWYRYCSMEGGIRGMEVVAIRIKSDMVRHHTEFGKARADWYCGFPGRFFGLVLLFSARDGTPLALLHDAHMQHMRVAGTHILATRHMAREDASVVGIIGSGGMAWAHAYLLTKIRRIGKIKVYSPNAKNRSAFAEQAGKILGIETVAMDNPQDAVRDCDIVAGCTSAAEPVLFGEWLKPGMHVILTQASKELDEAGWRKVSRFVSYRSPVGVQKSTNEHRWTAPPDWRFAGGMTAEKVAKEQKIFGDKLHELPDLLLGRVPGRESADEITCCANEGTGVQFAAVANEVYVQAKARGLGIKLPLDWFLQDVTN
jgi:alanine dehydrogenase